MVHQQQTYYVPVEYVPAYYQPSMSDTMRYIMVAMMAIVMIGMFVRGIQKGIIMGPGEEIREIRESFRRRKED